MTPTELKFLPLAGKTVVVHSVTYFLMGILASTFLDYSSMLARPEIRCWMRQMTDPMLMAGPLFQPARGLVFAFVIYALRDVVFGRPYGWFLLGSIFVALGIVGTFGPTPGSLEGLVYTVIPVEVQLAGYAEVVPQAFLLAYGVVTWVQHPRNRWLTGVMVFAFVVAIGLPLLGLVARSNGVE